MYIRLVESVQVTSRRLSSEIGTENWQQNIVIISGYVVADNFYHKRLPKGVFAASPMYPTSTGGHISRLWHVTYELREVRPLDFHFPDL